MNIFKPQHSRKLKSDELTGLNYEVAQEDYTSEGKQQISNRQIIVSILQLILGSCLAVSSFMLYQYYPYAAITIAVFAILSFFSSLKDARLIGQSLLQQQQQLREQQVQQQQMFQFNQQPQMQQQLWYNTQNHRMSQLLLTCSIVKAVLLFASLVTMIIYKDSPYFYFIANNNDNNNPQEIDDMFSKYKMIVQITFGLGCLNMITLLWTTFSSFAFSNSANVFRFSLYVFSLITLSLCGGLVYMTFSSKYLENIHSLQQIADFWSIRVLLYISIIYILTLIAILMTNLSKSINFYMSVGTLLLLLCIILVSFNGKIYRNAKLIQGFAQSNCQNEMQMVHEYDLIRAGCPNKYVLEQQQKQQSEQQQSEQQQSYPKCEMGSQAIHWENDLDKQNINKLNSIQCLNTKCCPLIGQLYADWFYLIATLGISFNSNQTCTNLKQTQNKILLGQLISLYSFVIVGMCYYLSSRYSGNGVFFKKIECVFLVLSISILVMWSMLIIYQKYEPISQKPGILSELKEIDTNSDYYKLYTYADVTKRIQCEKTFSQFFQIYYNKSFAKNALFDCNDVNNQSQCLNSLLRISVTTNYYKIIVSQSYNDPKVKVFDTRFAAVFNNAELGDNQDFLAAEGTVSSIKNFFLKNVCLYSYDPQANHNMIVRASKVNTETGKTEKTMLFKPQKDQLKQINKQLVENKVNLSQAFSDQREKNLESSVSFESIELNIKDQLTNKEITGKEITVKVYFHHYECIEQSSPPQLELNDKKSTFLIQNQYSNTYTIFVKAEGYNYSCIRVHLTDHFKTTSRIVYMNPILKNNEMRVVLEWSTHTLAQLDLLATIQTNDSIDCIVGYLNENCQKIFYERKSAHPYYQTIKIDKLGANNYLFYIKHNLSEQQYLDLIASGKKNINQILAESGAHVSIYVAGLEYPIYESGIQLSDNKYSSENNLLWLVACMNGTYGNQVHSLNQYWTTQSQNDYIIKSPNQSLPPAEICSKYFESLYS